MPVIRIEVPEGTASESKKKIREQVKQAVLKTLAPKETKYDYVAIREAFGEIGDGLPLVEVVLYDELQVKPEDIYLLYRENPAMNHYTGGTPLPDWVPADR
jgi:hypothetical protein